MSFQNGMWQYGPVCKSLTVHQLCVISVWQETDVNCPLDSLWAAGWWGWAHSLSSQDRGAGRGCLYTPGRPFWLCQDFAYWGVVPSVCSCSSHIQTEEREPWRALEPGPSPAGDRKWIRFKRALMLLRFTRSAWEPERSWDEQIPTVSQKLAIFIAFSLVSPFLA